MAAAAEDDLDSGPPMLLLLRRTVSCRKAFRRQHSAEDVFIGATADSVSSARSLELASGASGAGGAFASGAGGAFGSGGAPARKAQSLVQSAAESADSSSAGSADCASRAGGFRWPWRVPNDPQLDDDNNSTTASSSTALCYCDATPPATILLPSPAYSSRAPSTVPYTTIETSSSCSSTSSSCSSSSSTAHEPRRLSSRPLWAWDPTAPRSSRYFRPAPGRVLSLAMNETLLQREQQHY